MVDQEIAPFEAAEGRQLCKCFKFLFIKIVSCLFTQVTYLLMHNMILQKI